MAGLMHDIGKFILEIRDPERYDALIAARSNEGRPLLEMEREEFGFDHALIGGAFARIWNLPDVLICTMAGHHGISSGDRKKCSGSRAVPLVMLADYLANTMMPVRSDLGFDPRLVDAHALAQAADISIDDLKKHLNVLMRFSQEEVIEKRHISGFTEEEFWKN